jgi:hypothetical protein
MSQIIQKMHSGQDTSKGMLTRSVVDLINANIKARKPLSKLELDLKDLIDYYMPSNNAKPDLVKRLAKLDLLSNGITNAKTVKDAGLDNISNWILYLSPSDLSGVNLCPSASQGCRAACLNGAGRGLFDGVQLPRLRKTLYFIKFRQDFLKHIDREIGEICKKDNGKKIIVRLNGTSDLAWERFKIRDGKNIFELYPNVTFYDYTKVFGRLEGIKSIPNYHVTFSCNEANWDTCIKALNMGINIAIVFRDADLPATFEGYKVISGDTHDFRFLDPRETVGVIVGLKAKGPARRDKSGFVKDAA